MKRVLVFTLLLWIAAIPVLAQSGLESIKPATAVWGSRTDKADGPKEILKKSSDLPSTGTVDVIIQFTQPGTQQQQAVTAAGGILKKNLGVIKGALFSVPAQ